MPTPTIWLLSPYRSDSHASWADRLVAQFPQYRWRRMELPGRHFRWRIRGNPLSWLDGLPAERPSLLLATSMTDLATLKGLHPQLAGVPSVCYFHENQFAYPESAEQFRSVDPQMVQLYAALAADRVLFNSTFNRDSFLEGVEDLLARLPDAVPTDVVRRLRAKSGLLPVPVEPVASAGEKDSRLVLWNHRWEYDKAPEVFAEAALILARRGVTFRLALLGSRPVHTPEPLRWLRQRIPAIIVADGKLAPGDYRHWLGRSAVAVSTARQEFQGLAMLEAVSAGARPLVPDALCYREQFPDAYRYAPDDAVALAERLQSWLEGELPAVPDVSHWLAEQLWPEWARLLAACTDADWV